MKAEYHEAPSFGRNPFIEAMPYPLSNMELASALRKRPETRQPDRELPAERRLLLLSRIYEAYLPPDFAPTVYQLLYQGIIGSYAAKNTADSIRQTMRIQEAIVQKRSPDTGAFTTQAASCSILGVSGTGKTSAIIRVLDLIPQVIEHTEYRGEPFFCKQVCYLHIQCPNDCSVKAACIYILLAIDKALGTQYAAYSTKRMSITVDAMVAQISQLCLTHHIGAIVIDEIQNILTAGGRKQTNTRLLKFLVQLMNDTGVCVVLVGTPEVGRFFDSQPHLTRRTRGPRIYPLEYGPAFQSLLDALWETQCLKIYEEPGERVRRLLYEISGGVPALLAQTLFYAQQYAIHSGKERISEEVLRETASLYQLRKPDMPEICRDAAFPNLLEASPAAPVSPGQKGRPRIVREANDILAAFEQGITGNSLLQWMCERGLCMEENKC